MLDNAKTKRDQAMQSLGKNRTKIKLLTCKKQELLVKAMSSTANTTKKREKIRFVLNFLVVDVQSRG